jgi:hypothetical protein
MILKAGEMFQKASFKNGLIRKMILETAEVESPGCLATSARDALWIITNSTAI